MNKIFYIFKNIYADGYDRLLLSQIMQIRDSKCSPFFKFRLGPLDIEPVRRPRVFEEIQPHDIYKENQLDAV